MTLDSPTTAKTTKSQEWNTDAKAAFTSKVAPPTLQRRQRPPQRQCSFKMFHMIHKLPSPNKSSLRVVKVLLGE
eukprot:3309581-Pyramimonas_sp.AAC.1